jgi:putative transposase
MLHNGEKAIARGKEMRDVCATVSRRVPGSKGKHKARSARDQYIDQAVDKIPWNKINVLVIEDLTDLKRGKKKNQSKKVRKMLSPWRYRRALNRIEQRCQENGVRLVRVNPANTSRCCPNCGKVSKLNRSGEEFLCIACGHTDDADGVGALNILRRGLRFLGSLESPRSKLPLGSKQS